MKLRAPRGAARISEVSNDAHKLAGDAADVAVWLRRTDRTLFRPDHGEHLFDPVRTQRADTRLAASKGRSRDDTRGARPAVFQLAWRLRGFPFQRSVGWGLSGGAGRYASLGGIQ
ncbi:hypothetical protein D3C80_1373900 [compost metagenome]